jgi:dipeptidyl aminopeptidase/acylaminoacyl peptidase
MTARGGRVAGWRVAVAVTVAVLAAPAPGAAQSVTLEALLGNPFPSALTASADGRVVAWVQNARGVRNVWVAAAPAWQGRQLTAHTADDGQDLGGLALSPDGATLYFVRGGGPNRRGEFPNPTSDPAGAEQMLWRVALAGGVPARIGPGAQPVVSPRGDRVVFSRRGQVFSIAAGATAAEPLFQVRGGASDLTFSPDGGRLAFTSSRGDHAFVGVYDLAARRIRWMDPSFDRDQAPAWSPDGRHLAFVRIPAGFDPPLFGPIRESEPWSVRVADAATGAGREVWRAAPGRGSVFRGVTGPALLWSADGRLVFPWERTGWLQLYSVPVAGGDALHLTPGEGEVEYVALAPGGREVLYNANIGDIDRRDLFRVPAAGGAVQALTSGPGIEWAPVAVQGGLAFLRSDARVPAHAVISVAGAAPRPLAPRSLPGDFPSAALVDPVAVEFPAADGMRIPAQLFLPPGIRPGERRPAVAFFHGGSRRQMLLGWHYMGYYHSTYALNQYLASRGYVVLSVNFRSGTGYGLEFREALRFGATGASELYDVMGAGLYLRGRPDVDPGRVGLWGGSYGGYLTAMGLSRASDLFAAGVDIHGVHDWNAGIRTFRPDYNPLARPEFARTAFESSPMAWVDRWRSPVLLIHGDDDRNVDFGQSVELIAALRARGVEVEHLVFPDDVHDFLTHANWFAAARATADFFDRRLGR